ncbi:signal recognition particle-docking protein FtsY [Candidatus Dependentiae bacterium]|nr:signal recognition particle-docking protein FtsY [Candidatus Dependentiae bacterium]
MFNFIKEKLHKIYFTISTKLHDIFSKNSIDQATINELQEILLKADTGVTSTKKLITQIQNSYQNGTISTGQDIQRLVEDELLSVLNATKPTQQPQIYLLIGINGSGKTTFAGKLAYFFKQQNKSVILAAADTFRAAAPEQLQQWAQQSDATLIMGKPGQEPASVTFDACQHFKNNNADILIIDTAGRLQTKENLIKELEKIQRIIQRQLPHHTLCTILTIDAMLGQNSFIQAKLFHQATNINGIALTKMDGTAKGGIIFSIAQELKIPVLFLCFGEHIQDLIPFEGEQYIQNLLGQGSIFKSHKNKA